MKILTEISARHVHLSKEDSAKLFGKNYKFSILKKLSQPEQFATKETLTLLNKNNLIHNIRIIMPERKQTQIEISKTDAIKLKTNPPVNLSGNLLNAPKIILQSKKARIKAKVIIAKRHIHISKKNAKKLKLKNAQSVKVKIKGKRALIFDNVKIRIAENCKSRFHIDTDEANSAGIFKKVYGEIIL